MSRRRARTRMAVLFAASIALAAVPAAANPFYGSGGDTVPAKPLVSANPLSGIQAAFKNGMASAFEAFGAKPGPGVFAMIVATAFLYGILHAAGPGHRKIVVFSLFMGRKAGFLEPLAAGFLSAGIHAASGGLILFVLSIARGALASLVNTENFIVWMDGVTLCLMAALALFLIVRTAIHLATGRIHEHGKTGKSLYSIIAFASLVPCPGAIMVVMFSLYMNAPAPGIAAFISMSLGMGLVVSAAAYLGWFGRQGIFQRLKTREHTLMRVSGAFEILSYAFIMAVSLYAAWPFIVSLGSL